MILQYQKHMEWKGFWKHSSLLPI